MRTRLVRPVLPVLPVLALTAVAALAPAYAAGGVTVTARDNSFSPVTTSVAVDQQVTWRNAGALPHEVTAVDGSFASGNLPPGAAYTFAPSKAGRVEYYCRYHGTATTGMIGTLSVGAKAATLPKTGGGRQIAVGVAVLALTTVLGGGLHVATREGSAR